MLLERPRDQESLRGLAAVFLEEIELRGRLHALGDHAQPERMRQRDDRLRDRHVVAVVLEPVDEALVDLDRVDGKPREIGQARVAGAEIVDGDRDAALLQLRERRDRLVGMRDDDAFGDLEIEILRREAARRERLLDDRQAAVVLQLLHRQVDRQTHHHALPVPLHDLPARVAQHARAERLDHPGFLGDRDELRRRDHAAHRIAPAQERLDRAGPPRLDVDLRLVGEEELVLQTGRGACRSRAAAAPARARSCRRCRSDTRCGRPPSPRTSPCRPA